MKIITDTSSLFTPEEGAQAGLTVIPSCTIIGSDVYRDYADISSEAFLDKIREGAVPTTSQPSISDVIDAYEGCQEDMLVLPIGDGLSGTYQNMTTAAQMAEGHGEIHVIDTQTLAGPQRYLVRKAMMLRDQGKSIAEIKDALMESIRSSASFVIPQDFNFLRRSGRLTAIAAKLGTVLKIVPILTQTEDMKRITVLAIKRARNKAVAALIDHLKEMGVDEHYLITIAHGGVKEEAMAVMERFREQFRTSAIELFTLPPTLICHGGPGCIVVQTIKL